MLQIPLLLLALLAGPLSCVAWWDHGHMLVAHIAKMYLDETNDLEPLMKILQRPDGITSVEVFNDFAGAAVWMDQIKCTSTAPYCPLPSHPSFNMFDNWHYGGKCIAVNSYPETANPCPGMDRVDAGLIDRQLGAALQSSASTRSPDAAAFQLRVILHLTGDMHQPLHASGGAVDANHPNGDIGGNARRFNKCNVTNLHALWDSAGNMYTLNWSPGSYNETLMVLQEQAVWMIASGVGLPDPLGFDALDHMNLTQALSALVEEAGLIARLMTESARAAKRIAYNTMTGLNLNPAKPGGALDCPTEQYFKMTQETSVVQIACAGYRLSRMLRQVSRAVVANGLLSGVPPLYKPRIIIPHAAHDGTDRPWR